LIKTVFITQNLKNLIHRMLTPPLRFALTAWLAVIVLWIAAPSAQANDSESVSLSQISMQEMAGGHWALNAQVSVVLSPVLVDAVKRGVPLYFVTEFELTKKRWYWFDQKTASQAKRVRISYHALTQQYRVAVGGLHQMAYPTLEEALLGALSIRGWLVLSAEEIVRLGGGSKLRANASSYEARLRLRLDSALLPKPLQVDALTSKDWNLSSDWIDLVLAVEPAEPTEPGGVVSQ
jgi:hypothetical protein